LRVGTRARIDKPPGRKSRELADRSSRSTARPIILLFVFWSLWLSFEFFCLGPESFVLVHDNGDSEIPVRMAFGRALETGNLGFWTPERITGLDALAGKAMEVDAFSYAVLPGWLAYGLLMWLQRFLAGYFTYRLLRDSLRVERIAAIYAGLAYSLYSQVTQGQMGGFAVYDGLGTPGVPLLIWALARPSNSTRSVRWLLGASLGFVLSLTSGYYIAPFIIAGLILWMACVEQEKRRESWLTVVALGAGWLVGELPFLWASTLSAPAAHRADRAAAPIGAELVRQIKLLYSLTRLNWASLALGIGGVIILRREDKSLVRVWFVITVICGVVLSYPLFRSAVSSRLGFLKGFQFDRFYWVAPFFISVLGGLGLNAILRWAQQRRKASRRILSGGGLIALCGIAVIVTRSAQIKARELDEWNAGSRYGELFERSELEEISQESRSAGPFRIATIADPGGLWHPSYAWAYGLETVDGYENLYPQRYQDFWGQVIAPLTEKDDTRREYFEGWGNRVYLFSPTDGFESTSVRASEFYDLELLSLTNVRYLVSPLPLFGDGLVLASSPNRSPLEQTATEIIQPGLYNSQRTSPELFVYRNTRAFPRAFLAHRVRLYADSARLLADLSRASCDDLMSTAFLQQDDVALRADQFGSGGNLAITDYAADAIRLTVDSHSASILIVTNNYSPFWTAWIDEREADLFPVDHAFQGLLVEEGSHQVLLAYSPPYAVRLGDSLAPGSLNGQ
jgi:hypothetical protein